MGEEGVRVRGRVSVHCVRECVGVEREEYDCNLLPG